MLLRLLAPVVLVAAKWALDTLLIGALGQKVLSPVMINKHTFEPARRKL